MAFEDVAPSTHRMKVAFLCTLWSWENLYSVDNTDSLVDFWCGVGIGEFEGFFVGSPFCIPLVYSSGASLLFIGQYIAFYW